MLPLTNDNLPLANFDIFNRTYGPIPDCCASCLGTSGWVGYEYQGDPPMGGMVNTFSTCETCIGSGLCPGCMQPLALSFDASAFYAASDNDLDIFYYRSYFTSNYALCLMPTNSFVCLVCGWQYDPDRHYDSEDDYYDDYQIETTTNYRQDDAFGGYPGTDNYYA